MSSLTSKQTLSVAEASELLSISPLIVRKYIKEGYLKCLPRVGRSAFRITRASINDLLQGDYSQPDNSDQQQTAEEQFLSLQLGEV